MASRNEAGRAQPIRARQQGESIDSKDDQAVARRVAHIQIYTGGSPRHDLGFAWPRRARRWSSPQKEITMTKARDAAALRLAPLDTPTDLRADAVPEISGALN